MIDLAGATPSAPLSHLDQDIAPAQQSETSSEPTAVQTVSSSENIAADAGTAVEGHLEDSLETKDTVASASTAVMIHPSRKLLSDLLKRPWHENVCT